ncbi:MAG TPA: hypothetical protein VJA47_01970 [archaeon]|nr:hypothetical protein [archaeon]
MANIDVCKVCKKNVGYDSLEYYGEDLTCKGCCLKLLKSNIDPLSELSKRHSSGELSDEWTKEFTPLLKNKKTRSVKTDALTKFCSTCGKKIHKLAEICPKCGVRVKEQKVLNPGFAAVLSFLYAGLGQIYNGELGKGIAIFFVSCFLIIFVIYSIFGGYLFFAGLIWLVFWIFNIVDAHDVAEEINEGKK